VRPREVAAPLARPRRVALALNGFNVFGAHRRQQILLIGMLTVGDEPDAGIIFQHRGPEKRFAAQLQRHASVMPAQHLQCQAWGRFALYRQRKPQPGVVTIV